MLPTPNQLLAEIKNGKIPLANILAKTDSRSLLKQRDADRQFQTKYHQVWETCEKLRFILNRDPAESVRTEVNLTISSVAKDHPMISSVLDDFTLIAWQSYLQIKDDSSVLFSSVPQWPIVEWLFLEYKSGKYPCPPFDLGEKS
jgi:hypothetical protein